MKSTLQEPKTRGGAAGSRAKRAMSEPVPLGENPAADRLPLAERERLQKVFQHAKKSLEKADYAYAHDLFAQCVAEDPGALVYLQHFRANLAQMHPNATAIKSGGLKGLPGFGGGSSAVSKAAGKGAWRDAFAAGCRTLKKAPGDLGVLSEMAAAAGELGHSDCQLYYLRWALDLAPEDIEINRQAAHALEAINEFDQAIGCWVRVQQQKPSDEEAPKAIARLSVEKTINRGGYNPQLLKGEGEVNLPQTARVKDASELLERDPTDDDASVVAEPADSASEEELRAAIEAAPTDPATYARLADFYIEAGRLQDAERLLKKALKVAGGGDLSILEKLEDVHLVRMRERARVAERKAARQASVAAQKLAEQAMREANQSEVEVYNARAKRAPDNAHLQYELGIRLKRIGRHREAIAPLQAARADRKRQAEAELHLGECFQHIDQHSLAMRSYEAAIAACDLGDWTELRKLALYRAGVLAMGLRDLDKAQQHLTDLASADFGYRDVSERLDKLARIRKNG
ncbi:hypothetical protein MalM25_24120 [Planctomycetes bacterium MalM25]|nr:hypothetical protein MalM25_24120 [Planctomycetes bacterium MalM25]